MSVQNIGQSEQKHSAEVCTTDSTAHTLAPVHCIKVANVRTMYMEVISIVKQIIDLVNLHL